MTRLLTVALLAALLGTPALSQAPAEPAASPEAAARAAEAAEALARLRALDFEPPAQSFDAAFSNQD